MLDVKEAVNGGFHRYAHFLSLSFQFERNEELLKIRAHQEMMVRARCKPVSSSCQSFDRAIMGIGSCDQGECDRVTNENNFSVLGSRDKRLSSHCLAGTRSLQEFVTQDFAHMENRSRTDSDEESDSCDDSRDFYQVLNDWSIPAPSSSEEHSRSSGDC